MCIQPAALQSKSATLESSFPSSSTVVFTAGVCGRGSTADRSYTVTHCGRVCTVDNGTGTVDSFLHVHHSGSCNAVAVVGSSVAVGCSDGIVRMFHARTLAYVRSMPLPLPLHAKDVLCKSPTRTPSGGLGAAGGTPMAVTPVTLPPSPASVVYPAATAVGMANTGDRVVVVYGDRSLFVWDVPTDGAATTPRYDTECARIGGQSS